MNKIFKKASILFAVLPFLSAASEAPTVYTRNYKDYEINFIKEDVIGEYYYYYYSFKNIGDGYVSEVTIDYVHVYADDFSATFKDTVWAPGFEQELVFKDRYRLDKPENVIPTVKGYALFDDTVKVSGTKEVSLKSTGPDYYLYQIDMSFDVENDYNYRYGAILKVTYWDSTFYLKTDLRNGFSFYTVEGISLDKLTIDDVKVIKSTRYTYDNEPQSIALSITYTAIMLLLIAGGIFSAIFFPAMARRRRRRAQMLAKK